MGRLPGTLLTSHYRPAWFCSETLSPVDLGGSDSERGSPGKPDGGGRKQMNTALVAGFNLPPCNFLGRPVVGFRNSELVIGSRSFPEKKREKKKANN